MIRAITLPLLRAFLLTLAAHQARHMGWIGLTSALLVRAALEFVAAE